jgi:hypothetical protein
MTYEGCASTLFELFKVHEENAERHRVGRWIAIHMKENDQFAALNAPSRRHIKHLPDLAVWFLYSVTGIDANVPISVLEIVRKASLYKPDITVAAELDNVLKRNLSPALYASASALIRKTKDLAVREALQSQPITNSSAAASLVPLGLSGECARKRKHDAEELVKSGSYQNDAKKAKTHKARLTIFVEAVADVKAQVDQGKKLVPPFKGFMYRAGKVVDCINVCHAGSIDAFLEANKSYSGPSNFEKCSNDVEHSGSFERCASAAI